MLDFGLTQQSFFSEFHEKKPFIRRGAYPSKGITWADVDQAMYVGETADANLRVHKDGFVEEHVYTETCAEVGQVKKRIIKPVLAELLEDGASIIYNRMEGVSLPIRELCNQVARFVGASTVANGYISFGDKETFGSHWDTHDVFAIQLIGRKRWLVYEPTFPLPLAGQTSLLHKAECPTVPVIDEVLEAGDILYIPRGWWHTAVPLHEETFHIAVGVHPHSVADYVSWVAKNILPKQLVCRKSMRLGTAGADVLAAAQDTMVAAMFSAETFAAYQQHMVHVERCASGFNLSRDFRPDISLDIERGSYVANSKFDYTVLRDVRTVNGVFKSSDSQSEAVLGYIAGSHDPVGFKALREEHPHIPRPSLRIIVGDLLRRDIIACVTNGEAAGMARV